MTEISLVIPCFESSSLIETLVPRCLEAGRGFGAFELILVDDGSRDDTWTKIESAAARESNVIGCRLDRNYGEHTALMAGFRLARGNYIFSIDDDLQHRPEDLPRLLEKLIEGNDLVYGQYLRSSHSLFRRIGSRWNGWIASIFIRRPAGLHLSSFRGISKPLLRQALADSDATTYVDALFLQHARSIGSASIHHDLSARLGSRYSLWRLVKLHLEVVLSGLKGKRTTKAPKILLTPRHGDATENG